MSLIGSMRSNRLKLKRFQDEREDDRPMDEQIKEFIISRGDVLILPYLDIYDKDRIVQGKWHNRIYSSSVIELADASKVPNYFQTNSH